jgi:hypothetical protein
LQYVQSQVYNVDDKVWAWKVIIIWRKYFNRKLEAKLSMACIRQQGGREMGKESSTEHTNHENIDRATGNLFAAEGSWTTKYQLY